MLVAHAPPSVHLVLAGREAPAVPLEPLRAAGELGEIGRDDLAFTAGEVRAAAAALRRPVTAAQAAQLRSEAAGWPAAVRMALVAGVTGAYGPDTLLSEHVAEQVLHGLRPALADFVVAATTCGTLDASIAEQLSGQRPGAALLGECVRSGLLLDHFTETDREPVYRWHPVFAARCRAVVARRDPERADRLHRVAARALAAANPLRAVIHARRGNDPALALFLLEEHWLELVLRDGAAAVEELCEALPPPWGDDPIVLLVRACCSHVRPDRTTASTLLARAQAQAQRAGIAGGDRFAAAARARRAVPGRRGREPRGGLRPGGCAAARPDHRVGTRDARLRDVPPRVDGAAPAPRPRTGRRPPARRRAGVPHDAARRSSAAAPRRTSRSRSRCRGRWARHGGCSAR